MVGLATWGSSGGLGLWLMSALWGSTNVPPPPPSSASLSQFLDEWSSDAMPNSGDTHVNEDDCAIFNGTLYGENGCSKLAVGRIASAAVQRASSRAIGCANVLRTDCILGEEVGLMLPAVFVYSSRAGMRGILAPSIAQATTDAATQRVRVLHPLTGARVADEFIFYSTVTATFLETTASGLALKEESFNGSAAFCVQLLRAAYPTACWDALD